MRAIPLFLLAFVLALPVLGCDRQAEAPKGDKQGKPVAAGQPAEASSAGKLDRSHAGAAAPAASFQDPQGRKVSLSDFRGRPLLVNLWATWCAPCVVEMPTLDALAAREDGKLQLLAISQDSDRAKVDAFFAEHGFESLEPYMEPDLKLMPEMGVEILPTTILYDPDGREVWRMTGVADWGSAESARLIAEAGKAQP